MINSRFIIAICVSVLFTLGFCHETKIDRRVGEPNADTFIVVKFPTVWTQPDEEGNTAILTMPTQYALKENPDNKKEELFITLKWGEDTAKEWTDDNLKVQKHLGDSNMIGGSFSEQIYGVNLKNKVSVRQITLGEWDRSTQVLKSRYKILNPSDHPFEKVMFYEEKAYAKTGVAFATTAGLLSPNGKWLVVFSYTGTQEKQPSLIPGLGDKEPAAGNIFLDLYETSTGEKKGAAVLPFNKVSPSVYFDEALWAENKYFIMPIDSLSQTCIIGIVPS